LEAAMTTATAVVVKCNAVIKCTAPVKCEVATCSESPIANGNTNITTRNEGSKNIGNMVTTLEAGDTSDLKEVPSNIQTQQQEELDLCSVSSLLTSTANTTTTSSSSRNKEIPCPNVQYVVSVKSDPEDVSSSYMKQEEKIDETNSFLSRSLLRDTALSPLNRLYYRESEIETIARLYTSIETSTFHSSSVNTTGSLLHRSTMKRKNHSRILLLSGPAGTGKSVLASFVHRYHETKQQQKSNRNDRNHKTWWNYTLNGYFDQIQRPDQPYLPYIRSITLFLQSLDDRDRSTIAQNMYNTFSSVDDIILLKETIPEISKIFNNDSNKTTTTKEQHSKIVGVDSESVKYNNLIQNFKRLFPMILRCLFPDSAILYRSTDAAKKCVESQSIGRSSTRKRSSLILFHLQDVHWANEMDMDLLFHLTIDVSCPTIMFLVTCGVGCDKANSSSRPVIRRHNLVFDTVQKRITSIQLHPFNKQQVSMFLNNFPGVNKSLIEDTVAGNPYVLVQYLRQIGETNAGSPIVPIKNVTSSIETSTCVILSKLRDLMIEAQAVIKLASCLGKRFDSNIVQCLGSATDCGKFFCEATEKGLLFYDESSASWCFVHDKVQEMVYESMSQEERIASHYHIGRTLWRKLDMSDLVRNIFIVVDQLLIGQECLKGGYDEQTGIAKLCLSAGERAFQVSAFQTARSYFLNGISLLDSRRCWISNSTRDIAIQLHSGAAESCFGCGSLEEVFYHKTIMIDNVDNYEETIRVRMMAMNALGAKGHLNGAVDDSRDILRHLQERFPKRPGTFALHNAMMGLKRLIRSKLGNDSTKLLDLPIMQDKVKIQAMQVYNVGILYAMVARKELGFLYVIRIIYLTIQYGISELSCMGLAIYANWRWYVAIDGVFFVSMWIFFWEFVVAS
jgi:predicted ATPase